VTLRPSPLFDNRELVSAFLGILLIFGCSASSSSTSAAATGGSKGTGSPNAGASSTPGGASSSAGDAGPQIVSASDAGQVQSTVIPADTYKVSCNGGCAGSSTCDAQTCAGSETCIPTSQGSECANPCPGQLCNPATATPYCTRTGGVICQ